MHERLLMKDMEERYMGEGWSVKKKKQNLENHGA